MATQTQPAQIGPDMNPDAWLGEVLARFPRVHLITDNGLSLFAVGRSRAGILVDVELEGALIAQDRLLASYRTLNPSLFRRIPSDLLATLPT